MKLLSPPQSITLPFRVGISPKLKIRGIIATRAIEKDEIIERCPVVLVPIKIQEEPLKRTILWKYYFEWNEENHCIVLGYGSLINHSYHPNARYIHDYAHKRLSFYAIKNIKQGEEITVNYNYYPYSKTKVPEELTDFA